MTSHYLKKILVATLSVTTLWGHSVEATDKPHIKIGILQYVEHESLSANREGFVDGLKEAGYEAGRNLTIEYLNAGADSANLQSMSEKLVKQSDYLFAIATPAAQALATTTSDKPIYFSAVTDPVSAKLVNSLDKPGRNVSGTTDAAPLKEQLDLLLSIQPKLKKVGLIYNAGESNSASEIVRLLPLIEDKEIDAVVHTIANTNDISQTMMSLTKEVEGVLLVTDNTIASAMKLVGDLAIEAQIPLVGGSVDMVKNNGLATYGLDYYQLGKQTAQMLVKHLEEGVAIEEQAVESAKELKLEVNVEFASAINLEANQIRIPKQ